MTNNPKENKISQYIRERIKMARGEAAMSQEDLAKHLGKSRVAISDLERGRVQVNASDLALIAKSLEKPISYFFPLSVQGAKADQLTLEEKELINLFRKQNEIVQEASITVMRSLSTPEAQERFVQMGKSYEE